MIIIRTTTNPPNTKKGRPHPRDANLNLNVNKGGKTIPAKNSNFPNRKNKDNKAQSDLATKLTHDEGNAALLEENTTK